MTDPGPPQDPGTPDEERTTPPVEAATPEAEAARVARLGAYFRANRGHFTSEALKRAAATAGYTAGEIEAAWAQIGWGSPPAPAPSSSGFQTVAAALAFFFGYYATITLLETNPATNGVASLVGLLGLLGGAIAWAMLRESKPALARGIGCGVVLTIAIPIVFILVFLGLCLVTGTLPLGPYGG